MIRIGIVGAGAIGIGHKDALMNRTDCTIAAICDVVEEKAKALADGTQAAVYTDYKEMREKEQLDGVILNLPHYLHKEVTVYFLSNRIPTLVEKPMANSVEECDAMIRACETNHTALAVGHVQKYYKCHKYMRDVIRRNELGKLCLITETRNVSYFPNRPKWFLDKRLAGGGILMNYGAHTLDKILYMTGLSIDSVSANGSNLLTNDSVEAAAQVLVRLSGGCSAALTYSGCNSPEQYENYLYFTDGAAKIDHCSTLWIAKGTDPFERIDIPGEDDIMGEQLNEFVKMIQGKDSSISAPSYGREIVKWLEAAFRCFAG